MAAYHLQNMSLVKTKDSSIMNRELVIRVNPLLELVMIKTGKVLVTVRIINDLNGHREKQPGKAGQGVRVKWIAVPAGQAAEWDEWIDEDDEDIRLFDFGEGFFQGQEPKKLAQPGSLRVPETIFTDSFDYRVDLWRTGCMIYSFLFTTWPFWYLGEDEVLIFQMIGFVERLPAEWESKWTSMLMRSSHDLELEEDYGTSKLERKFAGLVPNPTLKPLLHVIQGLMRFLPSSRLTAEDALDLLGNAQE
ncbi:hypothetical protein E8E15_000448 [Penicillium rubens]|nr:hypothetical protein E8E15_000448 [Penicillium rubens]